MLQKYKPDTISNAKNIKQFQSVLLLGYILFT